MAFRFPQALRPRRSLGLLLATTAAIACGGESKPPVGPNLPSEPILPPAYRAAAFILDVDAVNKKVRITAPSSSMSAPGASLSIGGAPSLSLIGGDVIELTTSGFAAGAVGASVPNKVRVTFDVSITNRLNGVELITPTWPTPPAGVTGVFLFPAEIVVTTTSGGVSVGGEGNEVIVESPRYGAVDASVNWSGDGSSGSGAPHNFFNDVDCTAGSNDCYRWESFPAIASGSTTPSQQIGFDIDPTVGNFRARLIVAANLRNSGPPPVGSISGSVTSPQRGPLGTVTVQATGGPFSAVTDAAGAYSIANVNTGPRTVSLLASTLPSGCTAPAAQTVAVAEGANSVVNFLVTCTVPAGTVAGLVTSSFDGSGVSGLSVVVTPTGGSAQPAVTTSGTGAYSRSGVPVGATGAGSITLSGVPGHCTNASPYSYSGLTDGGTVNVNIVLTCTAPPAFYQYTQTWQISGTQATLTVRYDPSTRNDPAINGAGPDDFNAIQVLTQYDQTKLSFVSAANATGSPFQSMTANTATAGQIRWSNTFVSTSGFTAAANVAVFTFNIVGGATGSVTTLTTLEEIASFNFDNLIPGTQVTEATLVITP